MYQTGGPPNLSPTVKGMLPQLDFKNQSKSCPT